MPVEVRNGVGARVDESALAAAVAGVLDAEGAAGAECAVHLVGDAEIRRLNREHRGIDRVTDVLAFPIDEDDDGPAGVPRLLGDVVISTPQAARQSADEGVTPGRELLTLAVHGTLHLLGYDHEVDDGAMLRRQDAIVDVLPDLGWEAP